MANRGSPPSLSETSINYINPILWEDLPDMEVVRVEDTYYMSASSFHFSPGAPILRSNNLVDWEYIGHSIPDLAAFGSQFLMDGRNATGYVKGIWASTLKYRKSNGLFYWYGAIQGTDQSYIFTAKNPEGSWSSHPPIENFYYDAGLLIDEDDSFYVAYGTKTIRVAQLSADGLTEVTSRPVYDSDDYLEGARMYSINGTYYIWLTKPWDGQFVLKSNNGPFGPYEYREVLSNMRSPIAGAGAPHQGALVDTPGGDWYYMAFIDAFPAGRIPVLAPVEFDGEGWPRIIADYADTRGQWRPEYPCLKSDHSAKKLGTCIRRHSFSHGKLDCCWEWNQSPDNSKWSIQQGQLLLETGTVTDSLYLATNTLTHRTTGPMSTATFCINWSKLKDGDRAGASLFRDQSAYIGIHQDDGATRLVYVDDMTLAPVGEAVGWVNGRPVSKDWAVVSNGGIKADVSLTHERVWLRIDVNVAAACVDGYEKEPRQAKFEYSYDGTAFTQLGPVFTLTNSPTGFVGYRFAIFNFATKALGGKLAVEYCDFEL
ncbi:glycosyl hydrolase [Dactylonectria macrodidyma]|uniref:Glycosyl hydrolase n=1 Tax=Dactylonectria macrodidyma TaxID=307937 RepID=A0A9P9EPK7_9HYPO|nr:glycosyl hydrolase [Dactylonectria macrodidyma]